MSAARHLQYMGAHFVLLAEGKRPAWRRWNQRRPPLQLVDEHASTGRLGIIPASVRAVVVDVDVGRGRLSQRPRVSPGPSWGHAAASTSGMTLQRLR